MSFTTPIQQFKKPKMEEAEVRDRLEQTKRYNEYYLRAEQPQHCLLESQLAKQLTEWGHDPKRAKGIGWNPPETALMKEIRANANASAEEKL